MVKLSLITTIAAAIALVSAAPVADNTTTTAAAPVTNTSNTTSTATPTTRTNQSASSTSGILPQSSPAWLPVFNTNNVTEKTPIPTGPLKKTSTLKIEDYPEGWSQPDVKHPEVQKVINAIDWSFVPNFKPRHEGMKYDDNKDEACWWTNTQCVTPKVKYLPEDVKYCDKVGQFGLTYDDGPLPPQFDDDPWAEPRLYDFLAEQNQKATLFYVGTNVVEAPDAAARALEDGHTICAHTWSHLQMTTLTNDEIVAQLYWNLRAIKEATGHTTRCWRPPYGDIDDRVRAIAHQMGLATIIWDSDSFDWGLPSVANDFAGTYTQATVDGFFKDWIKERKENKDEHGRIVLEHETSNVTILLTEKWLPQLKKSFDVKPVHECSSKLPSPYWETSN
ncbi:hypothetical protein BDF20DRAFT_829201 [Mycotypha africana]|uniref:uncharacterized protein n=1 Tax=Mycotypha africana TaxID=64632 RepID=UPI0023010620|nr:uncharacterized protein BDF20DRAFT_829201 [Mycotypha africana]KAI8967482.1 hypothetical protein BDF20DRAFT_829201 [Mycotypha africana]